MASGLLFYSDVVPLNREGHRSHRIAISPQRFGFASGSNLVPAVIDEFPAAAPHLPIIFVPGPGAPAACFLTGVRSGRNALVGADGAWRGDYVPAYPGGLTGLTAAQMKAGTLGNFSGFDSNIWSTRAGVTPWLTALGSPFAGTISGTVYADAGVNKASDGSVIVYYGNGRSRSGGVVGADGTYSANLLTLPGADRTFDVLLTLQSSGGSTISGARYETGVSGDRSGLDLWTNYFIASTVKSKLSDVANVAALKAENLAGLTAVTGGNATVLGAIDSLTGMGLTATGDFAVDQSLSGAGLLLKTTGAITVSAAQSVGAGGALTLQGTDIAFAAGSSVSVGEGGAVTLTASSGNAPTMARGVTITYTAAHDDNALGVDSNKLTINGADYQLI